MAGGRPSKLDASTQQIICAAIRRGLGYEPAARMAGITYRTFSRWRDRGLAEIERLEKPKTRPKAAETIFVEFCQELQRAEAEGENTNADIISKMAEGGQQVTKKETYQKRVWDAKQKAFVAIEESETTKVETTLPDWRAAAFILERRHPDRWGRQIKTEVSGPGGKPVPIQIMTIEAVSPPAALRQAQDEGPDDTDGDSE